MYIYTYIHIYIHVLVCTHVYLITSARGLPFVSAAVGFCVQICNREPRCISVGLCCCGCVRPHIHLCLCPAVRIDLNINELMHRKGLEQGPARSKDSANVRRYQYLSLCPHSFSGSSAK